MARITIDYTPAMQQSAGIGRLTREVVRALLALETGHQFRLFCLGGLDDGRRTTDDGQIERASVVGGRSSVVSFPLNDRWMYRIWHRARMPIPVEWLAGGCDLFHATDFVLPPVLPRTRTVLTVHDLTFERDPASAPPQLLRFLKRVVPLSARRATHIVADSHATARDLAALYGIPREKMTVIHSGVEPRFFAEETTDDGRRTTVVGGRSPVVHQYGIGDGPFVLTVGTMQPRKNHLTLVKAFAQIVNRQSSIVNLVIAGGKGWQYDSVFAEVRALGLADRVKFIGFVDDADLPALYRAAALFVFPSIYEGFGIPPLEAMASGVPVVTSNASSLPEVVGDVGLMVDPLDVEGLAGAMQRALTDEAWRRQAVERGLARARQFTWKRAAEQLLGVYEQVLGGH
jgi:glycosyltransferase involved in cell wall biosynthesis